MTRETFVITQQDVCALSTMKISINTRKQKTLFLSVLMIATAILTVSAAIRRTAADGGGGGPVQTAATFTNYELAGNQFIAGHSQGITCPNASTVESTKCENTQAEPAIRADRAGNFYGSSESVFCVIGGQCGGTYAWRSTDGGGHFTTLPLPNTASAGRLGVSPAGGDTDIAVAPHKNANGFFNIYVASLDSTLASIDVSTSIDGGASWATQNPASAGVPVDDREWIAADGANKVCISYHSLTTTNDIVVQCSMTAGLAFTQPASAFDATHAPLFLAFNNKIGNLAIDPNNHLIYQVFSSAFDNSEIPRCAIGCNFHTVWIGVSIDGGNTFTDFPVYNNPLASVDYGHAFVNVSVDKAGNVYVVYSDDHNLFYSFSRTFGRTWSGPFQINKAPSKTAIYPWSVAGNSGQLDVVWYGTPYANGLQSPTDFPHCPTAGGTNAACLGVPWYVFFAQNVQATTPGSSFTQVAASGIIHYGDVCENGAGCGSDQNRDLLDDFGVAASPTTGNAAIIYTSDQYINSQLEPANSFGSRHCTSSSTNTVDCSHTDIAAQTGGSTINQTPHDFEVDDEDFEELDLSNNGGHSPHQEIDMTNTGTVAINKFDVAISGLPWTLTWSSTAPVQPGQSVKGTSTAVPVGLLLAVGNIYTVTITAKLADGTTETQTVNAIYSLGAGLGL